MSFLVFKYIVAYDVLTVVFDDATDCFVADEVVLLDLGFTQPSADAACTLVFLDVIVVDNWSTVDHGDPVHILEYRVVHDPAGFAHVHEDPFPIWSENLVVDDGGVHAVDSPQCDVSLLVFEDLVVLYEAKRLLANQDALHLVFVHLVVLYFGFSFVADSDPDPLVECDVHVVTDACFQFFAIYIDSNEVFVEDVALDTAESREVVFVVFLVDLLEFAHGGVARVEKNAFVEIVDDFVHEDPRVWAQWLHPLFVVLYLVQYDLGVSLDPAVDALAGVGADGRPVDLGAEALADQRDAPAFVVADDAVLNHDALILLAPAENALVLELLEAGVCNHHVGLEDHDSRTGVLFVAPKVTTLYFQHSPVGQHTRSFTRCCGQVEFAVHQWDRHIVT